MTALVKTVSNAIGASSIVEGEFDGVPGFNGGIFGGSGSGGGFGDIFSGDFDLTKLLSTGLNLASAGLAIFGADQQADFELDRARQQARALEFDAQEQSLEARREEVRGKQEANQILDNLIQTIAAQRVAFAGNGVDIGFGTPVSVERSTRDLANLQLSTTRSDALIRSIARRRQAAALQEERLNTLKSGRQSARNTRLKGRISAIGTVAEQAQRRAERG